MKNILVCFYGIFLLLLSIFSYIFVDLNLMYLKNLYSGFALDNRFITTALYILIILILFIFYGIFIWLEIKKKIRSKDIFILVSITIGGLILSYPAMLSYDIFNYIATSKVLFFYRENPYVIMPIEFIGDPLLAFTHASNKVALYGPFWILLSGIPYILGFENFITTLLSFKFFIAMFYLATTILIWKMSKNTVSVILFSLNPLIIIETLVNSHNDIVMIFFVLLSFFILIKKRIGWAIFFFVLSILIKYATLLLIPIFIFIIWKMIKKQEINWKDIFYYSSLLMLLGFVLSPIREEIYPWYSIWFLSFAFLVPDKRILLYTSLVLSFSIFFRYVPFMFSGTHAGVTPIIKSAVTFIPVGLIILYFMIKKGLLKYNK